MIRPLDGVTVVSVEQAVAAPYASSRLADAGARVIKVERPEGDFARSYDDLVLGESAYFVWLNRGKESICLDLSDGEDRAVLERMIARADVFIQNLKPGSLARLGFAMPRLREAFPRLICCSITGFGESGPLAGHKAYDLIVQAEAGLCAITGTADGPARVGVSVCDIAAGMSAHAAILQALFARERGGEGALIEVSLFDALADWMNVPFLQHAYGGHETQRAGVNHPSLAPYGAYRCADGTMLIFSVQNAREWEAFCRIFLADPAIAADARFATNMARLANRAELDRTVAARFAGLAAGEAAALLADSGIAHGHLNTIAELDRHPHLARSPVATSAGTVDVIAPAAIWNGRRPDLGAVPAKGEHTAPLHAEFG